MASCLPSWLACSYLSVRIHLLEVAVNYILDGKMPVKTNNIDEWARWYQTADRHVSRTEVDKVVVSTVFLGLDHNYSQVGPPLLFETMIFGGKHDDYQERYSTWNEAEEGHRKACALAFGDSV